MKKQRTQPAFATLTEPELDQLADWLRHETYEVILDRIRKPQPEGGFDLTISRSPLERLYAKVALLDLINSKVSADKKLTLSQFMSIWAGHIPVAPSREAPDLDEKCKMLNVQRSMKEPDEVASEAHEAILQTAHDLALSADNTPTQLLALQRLADFPARAEFRQHRLDLDREKFSHKQETDTFRKEISAARLDLTKQNFAFRQKQHEDRLTLAREKLSTRNSQPSTSAAADSLGPPARNWDELSERARIHFDVSKDEWSRRQSLHEKCNANGKNPEPPAPTLNPNPNLLSAESAPSAVSPPLPLLPPVNLETTVQDYTTSRAEEYWTWRRAAASLPDSQSPPPYITAHRHCPCGKTCPCSEHEGEPFGEFPTYFWSISPHAHAYEICLTTRNLPYRHPTECVPEQFRIYHAPLHP